MIASLPLLALLAAASEAPPGDLAVAWLRGGRVERRATADGFPSRVPLGSAWKLFVYAFDVQRGGAGEPYVCGPTRRPGEEYCCEPGRAVDRDGALARSCALYFEPKRLGIDADAWRAFWAPRVGRPAAWLADLERLRPDTSVTPEELLQALAAVPGPSREAASAALLAVLVNGYGQGSLRHLGGFLRVKTFTWAHPLRPGTSIGGGAGWLIDGTPVWFSGTGASRSVLAREAKRLSGWLPSPTRGGENEPCVDVDFFEQYPIRAVDSWPSRAPASAGALHGRFRVLFESGTALLFDARGDMRLEREPRLRLRGRFALSEYVGRVLDREADPGATEAARALSVVARTWLLRNARFEAGCFRVADSTRAQRVGASPATSAARRAALFTDGLVLAGADVRYRLEGDGPDVLAWKTAVSAAGSGLAYDAILGAAFPKASLAALSGERECRRLPEVEAWLARATDRWRRALERDAGFEPPGERLTVCELDHGSPHVDAERRRIYVRGVRSRDDRVTLAHEYVHVGFRFHPRGDDEAFVEQAALSLEE